MGVSKALLLSGPWKLEPFVFDPGPLPTDDELKAEAEGRIRVDRNLRDAIRAQKSEITAILQGCLDRVGEQLEKGEAPCKEAHFPLSNPFDFEDLEALAQHDFTIDLHVDQVDKALQELVNGVLGVVWNNISVENQASARALHRHNEALHARMETLEHHLMDRTHQLSNCRFKYYQEITHLRYQLYLKHKEGTAFEPEEVYYFEPTDFLEEGLRLMLNEKIKMSVRTYHYKLEEALEKIQALEAKLEHYEAVNSSSWGNWDDLDGVLRAACIRHGGEAAVAGLALQVPKDMEAWAAKWAAEHAEPPDTKELEEAQAELKSLASLLEEEQRTRVRLEVEWNRLRAANEALEASRGAQDEARQSVSAKEDFYYGSSRHTTPATSQPPTPHPQLPLTLAALSRPPSAGGSEELLALKRRLAELEAARGEDNERRRSSLRPPSGSELTDLDAAANEGRARAEGQWDGSQPVSRYGDTGLSEADRQRLLDHSRARDRLQDLLVEFASGASPTPTQASLRQPGSPQSAASPELVTTQRLGSPASLSQQLLAPDAPSRSASVAGGEPSLLTFVESLADLLRAARQAEAEALARIPAGESREGSSDSGVDGEEAGGGDQETLQAPSSRRSTRRHSSLKGGRAGLQPNLAGTLADLGAFLNVPPDDAEEAIRQEVQDLAQCATGNWDTTLEQLRAAQQPPGGHGPGRVPPSSFVRLFQTARQRIRRHGELIAMCISLKKAELQRILEGVHLLMESDLPDKDVLVRDGIFGRGFTQQALDLSTTFLDFAALEKRWDRLAAGVVEQLVATEEEVQLGVHLGRRTFVRGGGGGGTALAIRERRDFSPPRAQVYDAVEDPWEEEQRYQHGWTKLPRRPGPRMRGYGGGDSRPNSASLPSARFFLTGTVMPFSEKRLPERDREEALNENSPVNPHILPGGRISVLMKPRPRRTEGSLQVEPPGGDATRGSGREADSPGRARSRGSRSPPRIRFPSPAFRGSLANLLQDLTGTRGLSPEVLRMALPSLAEAAEGSPAVRVTSASPTTAARKRLAAAARQQNARQAPQREAHGGRAGSEAAPDGLARGPLKGTTMLTASTSALALPAEGGAGSPQRQPGMPVLPPVIEVALVQREERLPEESELHVPLLYLPFGSEAAQEMADRLERLEVTREPTVVSDDPALSSSAAPSAVSGAGLQAVRARGQAPPTRQRPSTAEAASGGTAKARAAAVAAATAAAQRAQRPSTAGEGGKGIARSRSGPAISSEQSGGAVRATGRPAEADREIERARQRNCGAGAPTGPLPTWVYDELEDSRARQVGGRHTVAMLRPEPRDHHPPHEPGAEPPALQLQPQPAQLQLQLQQLQVPRQRSISAGRLRPVTRTFVPGGAAFGHVKRGLPAAVPA